ncbi:Thiamine biosynthesis lipoprotein ApbE precursor [Neorhodopirellula pilleata]|uniref:FAD:protein FMN transferase n=2 Tax=Neorhodopirellula pilleata TaxID=2714738 RepID=A0A5C6AE26_9BACT|nr:Thiamine biosynthesis lipoprotein ApbE precursor [Neorhodopirellula pilleata]
MACDFVVLVRDEHQSIGTRSVADVVLDQLERVDGIEKRLTVYNENSEIAAINRSAGGDGVCVSPETFALLRHAQELNEATGGAFDITAGPLVEAWGFTRRQGRKPNRSEIEAARELVGGDGMSLDPATRRVSLAKPGMRLNLGGIGKGEAIDRLATGLKAAGIASFLIHAGQSSVLACGDQFDSDEEPQAESAPPRGWLVGLAHPTKPNRRLAGIWLQDAALATSGSGKQFFHHRGQRYGHVIDPRTGQPAGDLLSLSLVTDRAVDADALATGLFVMGREEATRFATAETPVLPLILVADASRQDDVEIATTGNWAWAEPPEGWSDVGESVSP